MKPLPSMAELSGNPFRGDRDVVPMMDYFEDKGPRQHY